MNNFDSVLEIVEQETNPVEETQDEPQENSGVPPVPSAPEIVDASVSQFFGFRPGDLISSSDKDYMQTIWNYYAAGAKTSGEVLRKISAAERSIEPPKMGETRLGKFYTYVRLLEESKGLNDELSAYRK